MRVAVVTETYPPEINGVALTVASFITQLVAHGHEVLLARPRQPADAPPGSGTAPPRELLLRGAALPRYPGLRFGLPAAGRLRRAWRETRPDAVYIATEGPLGWSALRAARALGLPAATGFHTRFDDFAAHYGLRWLTPVVFAWLRRFHNRADATLVPTRELQQLLQGAGFERVHLLRRGVDTTLFAPARRDAGLRETWGATPVDPVVLYLGRVAPEKNLPLAVRAFEAIRARAPGARFVWVGDGPALARMRREHPDYVYCGVRRGEELARHVASTDLFVFPSLTETFGNVTLEAMASGVPVVAYDYGAAHEHVADGVHGRLIKPGDADAFVGAAAEIGADAARREPMRAAARAAVEALSPATVAHDLVTLLAGLGRREAVA